MARVELNWYIQIIEHIRIIINNQTMTESEKIKSVEWLVRQLKSERND
jgi:hypothetical protein